MISLYRGELHKVSGVPRQWTVPKSQIPLSVFRSALKKRTAALNKLLQSSSVQKTDANAAPVANGTGEPFGLASVDGSGELGKRGGSENDDDSKPDGRAENGVSSDGRYASSKEQTKGAEEEEERRQERKRRREEDCREEIGRCLDRKEDSASGQGCESEATSRGKSKVLKEGSEPMIVDDMDQLMAMDCDVRGSEKTVMDCDETLAEGVRVRVTDVGMSSEPENKQVNSELGMKDAREAKHKDVGNLRRNGELLELEATGTAVSNFEEIKSGQIQVPTTADESGRGAGSADMRMMVNDGIKKREELEAKLEKLRVEKHRFVLRLKQVLNEEEVKKRGSLASGSPVSLQGAAAGPYELAGMSTPGERRVAGGLHSSTADLEDGELEYARTPSPPLRAIPTIHGSLSSHSTLGPPLPPVIGRQTSLSQHLSQSATGRGGYYVPGLGIPPSPAAPGTAGGALSPGAGFMGNLPSPLGSHSYSHNLALQHAAAIHAQKVTSVAHGHGQFSPIPPSGGPVGAGPGVAGGPPGFSGYAMSSSVHSHHSHLSQPASSSLPHIAGQQGSSSLLTTPRAPPGFHDVCLGGSTWIQR